MNLEKAQGLSPEFQSALAMTHCAALSWGRGKMLDEFKLLRKLAIESMAA